MSTYHKANTSAQWFQDNFPGADLNLTAETMVLVIHTTEGTDWPGYEGGATAPNDTAKPDLQAKRLLWRAHFPDEKSSRALQNLSGGVETNTLNAVQVELVGTCAPATHADWQRRGIAHIYWPEAPQWALDGLADFIADLHKRHGLRLVAPDFLDYPASFGASPVRFTFAKWRRFAGVCGHQHVPENVHGDPGALPIEKVLEKARSIVGAETKPPATLPAATFNVWTGQHGGGLRRNLRRMAKAARFPDVIALQEAHGLKRGFLRYTRIAADGFTRKEADNCVLLVHRKVEIVHRVVLSIDAPHWFGPKHGLRHPPRVFMGAVVEKDGRRGAVLCIHRATAGDTRNTVTRAAEVDQIAEWVHDYRGRHPDHFIVLIGDWNGVPDAIARRVDGKLALRGIDGAVMVGAEATAIRELDRKFGSDNHKPVVLTITTNTEE